ncbi:DNA polymerase I [Lactobacillus sp. S2-2]|uniref:DNA polymerase I n=1 Tax=Lactobacillus sp. S2-2 TaxID=2692917 RepID=UPI001F0320A7|nr:DNA polymerase I [Lactobacillus sp. S2-2]MCF6515154.1 DNA polymerase I [Lactobacillus sp. S2-2]
MKRKKVLLIDGNSIAYKAFFALYTAMDNFVNDEGIHTSAIYGFNKMLDIVLDEEKPDYVLAAFDAGKTTFRTKMFDTYKSGRAKTPDELREQFPYLKDLLNARGIKTYQIDNYEADDIIGTIAKEADEKGLLTTVITGDRDLTQLCSENTSVSVSIKGVTQIEKYTPNHVKEKLGIDYTQIIDMKGLQGDTSDNYPGVEKVGPKTAIKLLQQFGTIEGIYENIDAVSGKKLKEHLINDKEQAFLSKQLATIKRDAPINISIDNLEYLGNKDKELSDFYQKMNFNSYLSESEKESKPLENIEYIELNEDNLSLLNESKNDISFNLEMIDANYHNSDFVGFSIGTKNSFFVSSNLDLLSKDPLKSILESDSIQKNVFDLKRQIVGLNRLGINLKNINFDMLLVSYLLNTLDNSNDMAKISARHGFNDLQTDENFYGTGVKRAIPTEKEKIYDYLARKINAIESLKKSMLDELKNHQQFDLYRNIELPVSKVLAEMEIQGITVDQQTLEELKSKYIERLSEFQLEIYNQAGEEFNIGSPKQLGKILFEKLQLPVIKKTKTGYSTSVDVLEKLADQSPIVNNILQYRQLSKLISTYLEGLIKVIYPSDQKVHTRYLQTLTQTGRLSSVDPNLQNIPVKSEDGRRIRKAFKPEKEGWKIFSSDYSQIELRVLASLSNDDNMKQAFINGEDIHEATAKRIFELDDDAVISKNIRRQAKAVNFGIVYGISAYGLSNNVGISRQDAQKFIDKYFEEYPGIKKYMDSTIEFAKENGYVETISSRRRYIDDINAKSFQKRSFAERTAMNSPIQGSAADIIKIAMVNMQNVIKEKGLKSKLLLQVHDELIFEAPNDEIEILENLVPKVMDSAIELNVPLKVESHYGENWYDLK